MATIVISILINLAILASGTNAGSNKGKDTKDSPKSETPQAPASPSVNGGTGNWVEH